MVCYGISGVVNRSITHIYSARSIHLVTWSSRLRHRFTECRFPKKRARKENLERILGHLICEFKIPHLLNEVKFETQCENEIYLLEKKILSISMASQLRSF